MGDRCYLEITLRTCDVGAVREVLGDWFPDETVDDGDTPEGVTRAVIYEANYGYATELIQLANTLPFFGRHGAGCAYPAARFAAVDGKYHEADTLDNDDGLVVSVDDAGDVNADELAAIKRFLGFERRAREQVLGGQ